MDRRMNVAVNTEKHERQSISLLNRSISQHAKLKHSQLETQGQLSDRYVIVIDDSHSRDVTLNSQGKSSLSQDSPALVSSEFHYCLWHVHPSLHPAVFPQYRL